MTPPPSLQELIATVRSDAGSDDSLAQLETASSTATELTDTTDALLGHYVDRARRDGHSWTEISGVLGVTKQAVHKRFANIRADRPWFSRLTDRAARTLEAAQQAAVRLGHAYIGTEHLLLGLYSEPEAVATRILLAHDVTAESVEAAVVRIVGRGSTPVEGVRPLTPRATDTLSGSLAEALDLGHDYVGTEHVLLALFRDHDGLAYAILTELGLDAETARTDVIEALSGYRDSGGTAPGS